MPLIFSGETLKTDIGVSLPATNSAGGTVVVIASHEAIQDYGVPQVESIASAKYDRGQIEEDGTIRVRTADCAA